MKIELSALWNYYSSTRLHRFFRGFFPDHLPSHEGVKDFGNLVFFCVTVGFGFIFAITVFGWIGVYLFGLPHDAAIALKIGSGFIFCVGIASMVIITIVERWKQTK